MSNLRPTYCCTVLNNFKRNLHDQCIDLKLCDEKNCNTIVTNKILR